MDIQREKIACVLRVKNAELFLPTFLDHVRDHVDAFFVVDHTLSESAAALLDNEPKLQKLFQDIRQDDAGHTIRDDCERLYKAVYEAGYKWVLQAEADERFEQNFLDALPALTRTDQPVVYSAKSRTLWDHADYFRKDGVWKTRCFPLFNLTGKFEVTPQLRFSCNYPLDLQEHIQPTNYEVFSLCCLTDALRKSEQIDCKTADPQGQFSQDGYAFLTDESGKKLQPVSFTHAYSYLMLPEAFKTPEFLDEDHLGMAVGTMPQVFSEEELASGKTKIERFCYRHRFLRILYNVFHSTRKQGLKATVLNVFMGRYYRLTEEERAEYRRKHRLLIKIAKKLLFAPLRQGAQAPIPVYQEISKSQWSAERAYEFAQRPRISIAVPLYNTRKDFLIDMIDSVARQSYTGWELCLADATDQEACAQYIRQTVEHYQQEFPGQILYKKLEENRGIAENTNQALEMATGDYIALLDHDDLLAPNALFEVVKAITEQGADFVYTDEATFQKKKNNFIHHNFKPDFSPDTLRGCNYICHLTVFKRSLMQQAGMFREGFNGSQDHDLVLRLTEIAQKIVHIPKVLYLWRAHEQSVALAMDAKPYCVVSGIKAVQSQIDRLGLKGTVSDLIPGISIYRVKYEIIGNPKVSILIPNMNHIADLKVCIDSILSKTTYPNYEIVIVENNSTQSDVFEYYRELEKDRRIRVVVWEDEFNYSAINNFGMEEISGEYVILLNNDVSVITPEWIEEMLMFAQRPDVGAVGAKLYYPDRTIQHGGVVLRLGGVAGHAFRGLSDNHPGYSRRLQTATNVSAVTAACMMMRVSVFHEVGGFDERLAVAFNDVDLCLAIRNAGYLIVFTPFAELYHYESKSRGLDTAPEKQKRLQGESKYIMRKWKKEMTEQPDPYYNPNFTLLPGAEAFTLQTKWEHKQMEKDGDRVCP